MSDTITHSLSDVDQQLLRSLLTMGMVVEARDVYTDGHLWRVSQYSKRLAEQAGLSRYETFLIAAGGFLHDLGKVGVPDAILNKRERLSDEEYATVRTHPVIGRDLMWQHPLAPLALDAVCYHHERPDGEGYPYRLNDGEIPFAARIIAIADAFDAMTSTRSYRHRLPIEEALAILREGRGRQFDAMLCDHFLALAATGQLETIVAHSFHGRRLVDCPACGPAMMAIDAATTDGSLHYCRACRGEFRLHRSDGTFIAEPTGQQALPDQVQPRPDPDPGPIKELLAAGTRPPAALPEVLSTPSAEPAAEPKITPFVPSQVLLLQPNPGQSEMWRETLASAPLTVLSFPADSDLKIGLRIMAAENHTPDLVVIDTSYFLARNANPYAFASWLARWVPGVRLVLTNSAAAQITGPVRTQAIRRGAVDLLPALPDDRMQARSIVLKMLAELRRPAPAVELAEEEASEPRLSGPLTDAAQIVIAMRSPGGVAIQDRSYRFKTYPRCFTGAEAADWLRRTYGPGQQEVLKFGSSLVARKIIHHVTNDHDFKDEHLFYRFIVDEVLGG